MVIDYAATQAIMPLRMEMEVVLQMPIRTIWV